MNDVARCAICGEPMPLGEQMFKFHGYSGDCPKPPLPKPTKQTYEELERALAASQARCERLREGLRLYRASHNHCIATEPQGLCNKCRIAEAALSGDTK